MTKLSTFWLSVVVAIATAGILAFNPLLGVHGPESALVLGIVLSPFVAAAAAAYQRRHGKLRGVDVMARTIGAGLVIWAIPVVILAANALRVRQCAPGEGFAFMVLGPALGCSLAAVAGVWVAGLLQGSRWSPAAAALVPLMAHGLGVWAFYSTPTVHVFGVFGGYFPGAIYDDLVVIPERYLTYRAVTLVLILGLVVLFDAAWDRASELLNFRRALQLRFGTILLGGGMLGGVFAAYAAADVLGHAISTEHLVEALGKQEHGKYCVVTMPREVPPEEAARLVEDCDFQVARTRSLLGLESPDRVHAYFFRNANEKKQLIGVGRTLIAKPWRNEVYLQASGWPHRVLGHEVAHAVLRDAGRGPFGVAGSFGGVVPNPGIVEGAAVALAGDVRDDLTPDQWARILLDRDELPKASDLLSLRFSTLPATRAYMSAGSAMRFLIETRGIDSFLQAYREGEVVELDELDAAWREHLGTVSVTDNERGVAEVALARPSIFTAVCPHRLAKLRADLGGDIASRDDQRTIETCRSILEIDENEAHAHATLVGALARTGEDADARAKLDALRAAMNAPKPIVAAALEQYADASWTVGELERAGALYGELLEIPRTDGAARQSEVKQLGLEGSPEEQALVYEMLIEPSSAPVAVHVAQALTDLREDGLGPYLEARQLLFQGRFALALPLIEEAETRGLPTARLARELNRMKGIATFALGRYDDSRAAWEAHAEENAASAIDSERWLERIEYAETGAVTPTWPNATLDRRAGP
ncbi:MAG: hypothetical protein AAF997_09290 [Myxococcota bacterium]